MDRSYASLLGSEPMQRFDDPRMNAFLAGADAPDPAFKRERPPMNLMQSVFPLANEIVPMIDSSFRTKTNRENRAMAGLSMRGGHTFQVVMNNQDKFAYLGGFSGGAGSVVQIDQLYDGIFTDPVKFNERIKLMFLSIGSEENPEKVKAFAEALKNNNLQNVEYYESPESAHEWLTWRRSLREFAPLLFKQICKYLF